MVAALESHEEPEPVSVVRQMLAAWERLDWPGVMDLFAVDAVLHSVMSSPRVGRDAILEEILFLARGLHAIEMQVKAIGVIDGRVFVERTDLFDFAGNRGRVPAVGVFRVRDGVITEWLEYYDRATLLREMGMNSN